MSFVNAVAGPSRITLSAVVRRAPVGVRFASSDGEDKFGYQQWLKSTGESFRRPQKGQKARWLGGDVVSTPSSV